MFFDIGPLELVALVVLAVLVFGPEKLPKVIQDVSRLHPQGAGVLRQRQGGHPAELGPEFKDFEFEDLNPKTFVRKHLMDDDDLGLKEIRNGFDLRKELAEVTDAVNGTERDASGGNGGVRHHPPARPRAAPRPTSRPADARRGRRRPPTRTRRRSTPTPPERPRIPLRTSPALHLPHRGHLRRCILTSSIPRPMFAS